MILNEKAKNKFSSSKAIKKKSLRQISIHKHVLTENKNKNNISLLKFIKEKNNFKISDYFDEKNSKKFLDSKNKALSEIILSDELEIDRGENKKAFKYNSTKGFKEYLNEKTSDTDNKFDFNTLNNLNNSSDDNFIYKFILDNANESEEIFLKKLKKQMKSIDVKNKNSQKSLSKFTDSKIEKKKKNTKKKSLFTGKNPFRFSKDAKILMVKQPINASSIKSSNSDKNIIDSKISSIVKEEINENNIFNKNNEKLINDSINEIEFDSEKESLLNILSGLNQ